MKAGMGNHEMLRERGEAGGRGAFHRGLHGLKEEPTSIGSIVPIDILSPH
jgi:hypothetical protein